MPIIYLWMELRNGLHVFLNDCGGKLQAHVSQARVERRVGWWCCSDGRSGREWRSHGWSAVGYLGLNTKNHHPWENRLRRTTPNGGNLFRDTSGGLTWAILSTDMSSREGYSDILNRLPSFGRKENVYLGIHSSREKKLFSLRQETLRTRSQELIARTSEQPENTVKLWILYSVVIL